MFMRRSSPILWLVSLGFIATGIAVATLARTLTASPRQNQAQWRKVWGDDFNGNTLDRKKWTVYQTGQVHNEELQYYVYDEAWVQKGELIIRSRKRRFTGKDGTREYTSGKVATAKKFAFRYGTVEMRAKLPSGRGIWPAFWLLPAHEKTWPPEIDVMEMIGHDPHTIHMSNHHGLWPKNTLDKSEFTGPDFSADYHTYTLEWAPGWLRWKIDGVTRKETTKGVPDQPMYLILNTAVGGKWPGAPDNSTVFPQHFRIDYVHVYQQTGR